MQLLELFRLKVKHQLLILEAMISLVVAVVVVDL